MNEWASTGIPEYNYYHYKLFCLCTWEKKKRILGVTLIPMLMSINEIPQFKYTIVPVLVSIPTITNIWDKPTHKEEEIILTRGFKASVHGFSDPMALGLWWGHTSWQRRLNGASFCPHGSQEAKSKNQIPQTSSRTHAQQPKTSHEALSRQGSTSQ
jgi:hypothetical protein